MAGHEQRINDSRAICDASGFLCWRSELVRQWDGAMVLPRFLMERNPQDLIKVKKESPAVRDPRPEPTDSFLSTAVLPSDL